MTPEINISLFFFSFSCKGELPPLLVVGLLVIMLAFAFGIICLPFGAGRIKRCVKKAASYLRSKWVNRKWLKT